MDNLHNSGVVSFACMYRPLHRSPRRERKHENCYRPVAVLASMAAAAHANPARTASELYQRCTENDFNAYCLGYVSGVFFERKDVEGILST
jgi:hypothetical protein